MTSDGRRHDDLERRLERFLADTAPPIPVEVLDEVVSTIPRTPRERRTRLPAWADRLLPLVGTSAAIAVVTVALMARPGFGPGRPTPSPSWTGPPRFWHAQAEFVITFAGANPAPDRYGNPDVWSYRQGVMGASLQFPTTLLTTFDTLQSRWMTPPFTNLFVSRSLGAVTLHPWSDGATTDRAAVVAWTSPIAGAVIAEGAFHELQRPCAVADTPVEVTVHRDAEVVWSATLATGTEQFRLELDVDAGTVLSFVVSPDGNANCDGTDLSLAIRTP